MYNRKIKFQLLKEKYIGIAMVKDVRIFYFKFRYHCHAFRWVTNYAGIFNHTIGLQ